MDDVTTVQNDVTAVQNNVTAVQNDVTAVQNDVTAVQDDVAAVQDNITSVAADGFFTKFTLASLINENVMDSQSALVNCSASSTSTGTEGNKIGRNYIYDLVSIEYNGIKSLTCLELMLSSNKLLSFE